VQIADKTMTNPEHQPILGALVDYTPAPYPKQLSLTGDHVDLEPLTRGHASDLHKHFADSLHDAIWDYLPYGPFASADDYGDWIDEQTKAGDPHFFAIIDKTIGEAVGVASYLRINPKDGSIEVGHINYSPRLQGTIGATETMYLMMRWAFDAGYRRYEWKCNALNLKSRAAAQRLGFSYEGVFRQATITKGRNRDTAWFAMIDQEWPVMNAAFQSWLKPENFDDNGQQKTRLSDLTAPHRVASDPLL
jgi:RimJ/RimL family protein N-acetyltransferase